jgi:hypothetical protein
MSADRRTFATAQKRASDDDPVPEDLYQVGVTGNIVEMQRLPDETLKVFVSAQARAALLRFNDGDFLLAEITPVEELRTAAAEAATLAQAVVEAFPAYADIKAGRIPQALLRQLPHLREPGHPGRHCWAALCLGPASRRLLYPEGGAPSPPAAAQVSVPGSRKPGLVRSAHDDSLVVYCVLRGIMLSGPEPRSLVTVEARRREGLETMHDWRQDGSPTRTSSIIASISRSRS